MNSTAEDMVRLRGSGEFKKLVEEVFFEKTRFGIRGTYGEIANLVIVVMGVSAKLSGEVYKQISMRYESHRIWRSCIGSLCSSMNSIDPFEHVLLVQRFYEALRSTRYSDLISESVSPICLLYLMDRLLVLVFCFNQPHCFFSTKSAFLEWIINQDWHPKTRLNYGFDWQTCFVTVLDFVAGMVEELLCNEKDVIEWIVRSKLSSELHALLVLRLFTTLCLLCMNSGKYFDLLFELLGKKEISSKLPKEFCRTIQRLKAGSVEENVNVVEEAFGKLGNPLVIVRPRKDCFKFEYQNAILVDLNFDCGRDKLMNIIF